MSRTNATRIRHDILSTRYSRSLKEKKSQTPRKFTWC